MNENVERAVSKVPQITALFWVIKIVATTLGETAGDALSMGMNLGYAVSSSILLVCFCALCFAQLRSDRFRPLLYWSVVIATTTVGTTIADFADRSLGLGYAGGIAVLTVILCAVLAIWRVSTGSIAVSHVADRKQETFYWIAILASNTLGTAVGDYVADGAGLGYGGGALAFLAALSIIVALWAATETSTIALFWAAFVLTRPLGATVGDLLTKPTSHGGLELSTMSSSAVLVSVILALVVVSTKSGTARPSRNMLDRSSPPRHET